MNPLRTTSIILLLALTSLAANVSASNAPKSHLERFLDVRKSGSDLKRTDSPRMETMPGGRSTLSLQKIMTGPADQCTVFVDYPYWALYDWMTGMELYESYMDLRYPLVECDTTYPFMVTHVCQTIVFNYAGTVNVQGFIADLDPTYSTPDCPFPGEFIEVTEEFPGAITEPGVYILDIDFDPPVEVYGPYFAGMYYANDITAMDPGVGIDTIPYLCIDYNDWGEGLVDLADNLYYPFPGSLDLFTIGYNGGGGTRPQPHVILPAAGAPLLNAAPIWIADLTDTVTYMGCYIECLNGSSWIGIGVDLDGTVTLRNGLSIAQRLNGWQAPWDPQGLPEGSYSLRASIIELDSSYVSDTVAITYDQYPLQPQFVGREDFAALCEAETLKVTVEEPNVLAVTFSFRELGTSNTRSFAQLDRNSYGDANGNPADGNHYYAGEFGEYYAAPALFGSLLKYWYDHGFPEMFADADSTLTLAQLVEHLADMMKIRSNLGAEDDNVAWTIVDYLEQHGGMLKPAISVAPDWEWLTAQFFGARATVGLAVSQPFGHWLAVQQIGTADVDPDSIPATIYDPAGGILREAAFIPEGDSLALRFAGGVTNYHIDLGVAIYPDLDTSTYRFFASDNYGGDDYTALLPIDSLEEAHTYLMRAKAHQSGGGVSSDYWIMRYSCGASWLPGDADNNGSVNISDAVYMIAYIFGSGPLPQPEWRSGDADCNNTLNIADAVYLIAFIFGSGPAPASCQ